MLYTSPFKDPNKKICRRLRKASDFWGAKKNSARSGKVDSLGWRELQLGAWCVQAQCLICFADCIAWISVLRNFGIIPMNGLSMLFVD
jgi:hypothetical protein